MSRVRFTRDNYTCSLASLSISICRYEVQRPTVEAALSLRITGDDHTTYSLYFLQPLTTVVLDFNKLARRAVE